MSQDNVRVFRRWTEHWNRRDLDAGSEECIHPDIEWIPITSALEGGGAYRGHEGVRRWAEQMSRDWELFEIHLEDARVLGADRVLALGSWRARGPGSGIELRQDAAWLIAFRDGTMVRLQTFTDRAMALEALGLSEWSGEVAPRLLW